MELEQAFSFWLDRTSRMMKYFASSKANELDLDITIDQWVVLAMIVQNDDISQKELCNKTFKDKASVARISAILEEKEFIKRKRNPENRREYMINSTRKGEEKVAELIPYIEDAREIGIEGFSEKELTALVSMLQRIYINYEKALENGD